MASLGCRPRARETLVVYVHENARGELWGDTWDIGKVKDCGMAERSLAPSKERDLLLCGHETQMNWNNIWLKDDLKQQILSNSRTFLVTFHGMGDSSRGSGRNSTLMPTMWHCRRTSVTTADCFSSRIY